MRISDWSSDVCSSDLFGREQALGHLGVVIAVRRGQLDIARHRYRRLDLDALRRDLAGLEDVDRIERIVGRPVALDDVVIIGGDQHAVARLRSEEHTSELQSLMRISYAVFCLKKKNIKS